MITFFIISIISTIIFTYLFYDSYYGLKYIFVDLIPALLIGLTLAFLLELLVSVTIQPESKYIVQSEEKLLAIQDNLSSNESFYLGCGQVNGKHNIHI